MKEFTEKKQRQPTEKAIINLEQGLHRFVYLKKDQLDQICSPNHVRAFNSNDTIQLSGTRAQLDVTIPLVNNFLQQIRSSIVSETIINKDQCQILQQIMRQPNFNQTYKNITIKKFGGRSSDPNNNVNDPNNIQIVYTTQTQTVMAAQWSYWVKPGDSNWASNVDGFVDFDPDQNFQIEGHYQSCKSGLKQFGTRFKLIGDHNMVQNGWQYDVWGTSQDPTTWLEQNITLLAQGQQTPQRKLKRREVPKQIQLIKEQVQKAKELTLLHGQQFYDFALPHAQQQQQQVPAGGGGQMMQMGGGGGFGGTGLQAQPNTSGFSVIGLRD